MTREEIERRILEIERLAKIDAEGAHGAEDKLREDVLKAIAYRTLDVVSEETAAALALNSSSAGFKRWKV